MAGITRMDTHHFLKGCSPLPPLQKTTFANKRQVVYILGQKLQHSKTMSNPPQFSTLPAELRLKIWSLAFPPTQIVHIKNWTNDPWHSMIKGFFSPPFSLDFPSPLLSICVESRAEYLRSHRLLCNDCSLSVPERKVFFNPDKDILLLDLSWISLQINHPFMELLASQNILDGVKYLAMDFTTADGTGLGHLLLRSPLKLFELWKLFPGIVEFVFILGREEWRPIELLDVEENSEDGELKERILERVRHAFKDCKGHDLRTLPKIEAKTVRGRKE
jgi:hypothetical protein